MMLYIMRHGLAEEPTPKGDDGARKLTSKGADKIRKAAAGMHGAGRAFNMILTSPITRAAQTAEIVADELGGPKPKAVPELSTSASPANALEALAKLRLPESVLVVGHEPTLAAGVADAGRVHRIGRNQTQARWRDRVGVCRSDRTGRGQTMLDDDSAPVAATQEIVRSIVTSIVIRQILHSHCQTFSSAIVRLPVSLKGG